MWQQGLLNSRLDELLLACTVSAITQQAQTALDTARHVLARVGGVQFVPRDQQMMSSIFLAALGC